MGCVFNTADFADSITKCASSVTRHAVRMSARPILRNVVKSKLDPHVSVKVYIVPRTALTLLTCKRTETLLV